LAIGSFLSAKLAKNGKRKKQKEKKEIPRAEKFARGKLMANG
jgi:hypothetical protein